ncbi:MAG: HAMP domain-containing protein, partial [Chitinophagaceae bacterium]
AAQQERRAGNFSNTNINRLIDELANQVREAQPREQTPHLNESETSQPFNNGALNRRQTHSNSNSLHKRMIDMQSGFRGFLLTEDTNFLETYRNGLQNVPALVAEQKKLTSENAIQAALLDSIVTLHGNWVAYANSLIDARKQVATSASSFQTYTKLFERTLKQQVGKKINDDITRQFSTFDRNEYRLRSQRSIRLNESIERTHTFSFIFLTLTVIVGIGSTIYIVSLISKRIKTMVHLAENISKGEFATLNDVRNDELTRLSSALNLMSVKLNKNIRELERQNVELDKFAYVVSHDLKAPLRGIHNAIKWIREDIGTELSPQIEQYLAIIPQRTKRMEDLINGLLDYARTREKTPPEKLDVNELVKNITDEIVPPHFKVEMDNLPVFYSERLKLEQVFTNLISNAVKYTPHEGGHIIISCKDCMSDWGELVAVLVCALVAVDSSFSCSCALAEPCASVKKASVKLRM